MILTSVVETMMKVTTVMAIRAKTISLMIMGVARMKVELIIMLMLWHNGGMTMGWTMIKCQYCDSPGHDDGRTNDGDISFDERGGTNSLMVIK